MATIGITKHTPGSRYSDELDILVGQIQDAVRRAGGTPLLIPPGRDESALYTQFGELDGVLLSGGGDIDPACYGAEPVPAIDGVDPERDRTELTLAQWALAEKKPVFGICRGLQLLNVACGGALYRDMSEKSDAIQHTYYPGYPYDLRAHPITIEEGSILGAVIGQDSVEVNSMHHQACSTVAPQLAVTARAPDGSVEAVEANDHPFALAVQWHPESLPDAVESQALFRAFVVACEKR